jgi:hypothetical protein
LKGQEEIKAKGHTEVSDNNAVEATCTTAGKTASSHCSECGELLKGQEEVAAKGHTEVSDNNAVEATCTTAGKTASSHCSECSVTLKEQEEVEATGHTYSDGKCTKCGAIEPDDKADEQDSVGTEGLSYTLNEDTQEYSVTGYSGTDEDVVIPAYYEGLPVTSIGANAFKTCSNLKSIVISDSVTSIGKSAFYNCTSLNSVTIPNSVTTIGMQAFYGCASLSSIVIPNSVTEIKGYAFYSCNNLNKITIGGGVTRIGALTFCYCKQLTQITYQGTKEEWESIDKGANWNQETGTYTIYCTDGKVAKS